MSSPNLQTQVREPTTLVERRAPELCRGCERRRDCPIADWPDEPEWAPVADTRVRAPRVLSAVSRSGEEPELVWLTAESLGSADPALDAHPDLPVVFVFDEPLLARLRLSAKRLVFLVETLAELGSDRAVEVYRGSPVEVLCDLAVSRVISSRLGADSSEWPHPEPGSRG